MRIRKAIIEDLEFLVSLRNDPVSVAYSKRGELSKETIKKDFLYNKNKETFLVYDKNTALAYLIFEKTTTKNSEISIALAPQFRGKGRGTSIIKKGTLFALFQLKCSTITAKIYESNISSIRVFEKAGYQCIDKSEALLTYQYLPQNIDSLCLVFDFDGVIVDSISALFKSYCNFLHAYGYEGNRSEFDHLNGPSLPEIISYLKDRYSLSDSKEELLSKYAEEITTSYLKTTLHSGVKEVLALLHNAKIPIALATSSSRAAVTEILQREGILNRFEYIITGDEVTSAKPSPEIYQTVQENFPDHFLLVVEDSSNGLLAAQRAGLTTIAYGCPYQSEWNYQIDAITEVIKIITAVLFHYSFPYIGSAIVLHHCETDRTDKKSSARIIEEIWEKEKQQRALFNGDIVAMDNYTIDKNTVTITAKTVQYKEFLAALRAPQLNLRIHPLAVSGIIIDSEGNTLLAQRGDVTEYPNLWEFAPAGSIDSGHCNCGTIDFCKQIEQELYEETGIEKSSILSITPFALLFDTQHGVYDICLSVRVSKPLTQLIQLESNEEYISYKIVSLEEARAAIFQLPTTPTAKALIAVVTQYSNMP